jgi:hypothetical protein
MYMIPAAYKAANFLEARRNSVAHHISNTALRRWESVLFFIASVCIMLAGSDWPPPHGFWKVVIIIGTYAVIQYIYFPWLLGHIHQKRAVPASMVLFAVWGVCVAIGMVIASGEINDSISIWIGVVSFASASYGFMVWLATWGIARWGKKKK